MDFSLSVNNIVPRVKREDVLPVFKQAGYINSESNLVVVAFGDHVVLVGGEGHPLFTLQFSVRRQV